MLNQYFKIFKRDIELFREHNESFDEIEHIKLFQEDKIIIATLYRILIYNISEKKILVEKKMNSKEEKIIEIYGKNKFLIKNKENLNILFFELISNKKTGKYLLKQLGQIPIPNYYKTQILIKGNQLILDVHDISNRNNMKKNFEKSDNKEKIRIKINTLKVYNLNNFEFILNIEIPFLEEDNDNIYTIFNNKPLFFTLNNKTLGFFGSDNIYNNSLITVNTFKKNYALNEKKILNIQHIRLNDLIFEEVKCSDKKNNKFILYKDDYQSGFTEFFLYSSKDFNLISVIKCPESLYRINISEKGKVFGLVHKACHYFYEIDLEKNFILNNYVKYNLNDSIYITKILFLEKPQNLFINYDFNYRNFRIYLANSSIYYIIEDIFNFIICFFYISIFYREIYRGNNFPIKYFVIPILILLKLKLNWTLLHFILFNIMLFFGMFLKFSVAKGVGLSFLIVLFDSVLLIHHFCKDFQYRV